MDIEEIHEAPAVDDIQFVQLSQFQKQLPIILFGQMIVALAVATLVYVRLSIQEATIWMGLFTVTIIGRAIINFLQSVHPNTANNYHVRIYWHVAAVAATAFLWGGLAFFIIDEKQQLESLIIVVVIVGLVASSVGTTFNLKPAFLVFSSLTTIPAVIKLISLGQTQFTLLGILLLVYLYFVSEFEKRVYSSMNESIQLRFKNSKLIDNLTQEKIRAQNSQRNAELSLRAAESANIAKSQFLAAASHDLRQPLHALRLLSSTLQSTQLDSQQKPLVEHISSSVISLEELLNSLLDVSKLDAGTQTVDYSTIYLSDIFDNLNRDYASVSAEKNIRFIIDDTNLLVNTDVILLERLLSNLISNALRYTREGEIHISTNQQNNQCLVRVKDTGCGISKEDQERIFEEFVQLDNPERDRSKGIGLGLTIVKRTAELLDLPLSLESTLGEGTTFTVAVPIGHSKELNKFDLSQPSNNDDLDGMLVLVVDDEISIRVALEGLLDSWGCLSLIASDGDEAEKVMLEINTKPDVIIADLRLRDNETGIDVIERINEQFQTTIPAFIMTGEISPNALKALNATTIPFLHKPCDPQVLFDYMVKIKSSNY